MHCRYDPDGLLIETRWIRALARSLVADPGLEGFAGRVSDSGEGRWTAQAAIDLGVPASVLTGSLFQRFESRGNGEMAGRVLSAMRHAFGGHEEKGTEAG